MLMPTAVMNPVMTEFDTKRRNEPKCSTPARIITTPVTIDRVNNDRAGSARPARSTSAMMIAIAPVPCTAMNAVLVKSVAPTMPNR